MFLGLSRIGALILCLVVSSHAASDLELWEGFKLKHNRTYETQAEHDKRFEIFTVNMRQAEINQAGEDPGGATHGVTKFSDMTNSEFRSKYFMPPLKSDPDAEHWKPTGELNSTATVNWCQRGACTSVKNQDSPHDCGACFAFATAQQIESMTYLKHGVLIPLSVQQIVDCDRVKEDDGCDSGGLPENAYKYIMGIGGLERWSAYPFTGINGVCKADKSRFAVKVSSWNYVGMGNEAAMKTYVSNTGPLSVGISSWRLQTYKQGVLSGIGCEGVVTDHQVQLVGLNTAASMPYWIGRNTWGSDWGEGGYFRMQLDKDCNFVTISPTTVVTALV